MPRTLPRHLEPFFASSSFLGNHGLACSRNEWVMMILSLLSTVSEPLHLYVQDMIQMIAGLVATRSPALIETDKRCATWILVQRSWVFQKPLVITALARDWEDALNPFYRKRWTSPRCISTFFFLEWF